MTKTIILAAAAAAAFASTAARAEDSAEDPYIWLEEVRAPKALEWVEKENARSLGELESDPRYAGLLDDATQILTSAERIPFGEIHNGAVYNFRQDGDHVRGLWRRAPVAGYRSGEPVWETLIDFDKLAGDEDENWVYSGAACLSPDYVHCMVAMSYGGKDAHVWREFDTSTKAFVEDGFYLDEAKSGIAWLDADTLLVGTDRGEGSMTESGYPRTIVQLARGGDIAAAPVLFEGEAADVSVNSRVSHDGGNAYVMLNRSPSFFETVFNYAKADGALEKLPLPVNADYHGVLDGRAIFFLREPWRHQDTDYKTGSIIAYDLDSGAAELVIAAAENQSIEDIAVGESNLVITYLEDVAGKAARLTRSKKGAWKSKEIKLPANGVVKIASAGGGTDDALFSFESLTTPNTLLYVDAKNKVERVTEAPAFYDAAEIVVEQRFATSKDGTEIPYFIMAKKDVLKAGDAPTIQYGYGGFLAPILPVYYEDPARPQHGALAGRMWVSHGGVLVLSNLRGGSEYGPAWHKAAMLENHQNPIDDFIAISEDLIESGVTSAEKLGAIGRSNGGLLMGAILTQRPELYAAIDCGVPLFDMKRYTKLGAGASWVGEYGDPEMPDQWAYISKYSPYQNLKAGEPYPKVLFYTSTQDDRVHPGHARKAAARMTELGYDYFYYENTEGGHGGAANQEQLAHRTALEYVYFYKMLMGEDN